MRAKVLGCADCYLCGFDQMDLVSRLSRLVSLYYFEAHLELLGSVHLLITLYHTQRLLPVSSEALEFAFLNLLLKDPTSILSRSIATGTDYIRIFISSEDVSECSRPPYSSNCT